MQLLDTHKKVFDNQCMRNFVTKHKAKIVKHMFLLLFVVRYLQTRLAEQKVLTDHVGVGMVTSHLVALRHGIANQVCTVLQKIWHKGSKN